MADFAYHANVVTDDMSRAESSVFMGGIMTAVSKSNAASRALQAGHFNEAISLHRKALALKLQAYPEYSIKASVTYNGQGLSPGRQTRRGGRGPPQVASDPGNEMDPIWMPPLRGKISARCGRRRAASPREVRLRGAENEHMLCNNEKVSDEMVAVVVYLAVNIAC
jgi:hypothetical protein